MVPVPITALAHIGFHSLDDAFIAGAPAEAADMPILISS